MKKRGVSSTIVVLLLILVCVTLIFIFAVFFKEYAGSSGKSAEEQIACIQNVDLSVLSSCYAENQLKFTLKNNNEFYYDTEFFILKITKDGSTIEVPTNWHYTLNGFEQKDFIADISNPEEVKEAIFIPKIKQDGGYCYGQAISFYPASC